MKPSINFSTADVIIFTFQIIACKQFQSACVWKINSVCLVQYVMLSLTFRNLLIVANIISIILQKQNERNSEYHHACKLKI